MQDYWKGDDMLLELSAFPNVQVAHNVDATNLTKVSW